jgi:hypothetical protein
MKVTFEGLDPAVRKLQALPFPSSPDDDDLADIVSGLSGLTAEMLRAADRAGRGEPVWPDQVPETAALIRRLSEIQTVGEDDVAIYGQAVAYLEALDQIRRLLLGQ